MAAVVVDSENTHDLVPLFTGLRARYDRAIEMQEQLGNEPMPEGMEQASILS